MRRLVVVSVTLVALCTAMLPTDARSSRRVSAGEFRLESELLAKVPEVAEALETARKHASDADAWRRLGTILSRRGAHDDALRALDIAVRLDERNADAWVDLGAAYIRAEMLKEAIDALESALEVEPFHALAHYNLGLAHQARKHYDAAIREFKAALLLEPDLGDPVKNPAAAINPALPYVRLAVYLETTGATPSLFSEDHPGAGDEKDAPRD